MRKFKIGDIIVRIYDSKRESIGIFDISRYDTFIYLGDTFLYDDGGLVRFHNYGMGYDKYKYRFATLSETNKLIDSLKKFDFKKFDNNYYEHYLDSVIRYKNSLRKVKLLNLNKINDI